MTEINFHHGVGDPVAYACRLLQKAHQRGARVAVIAPPEQLARLDQALWTFEPTSFVAHASLALGAPSSPALRESTNVWLVKRALDAPHHEVLVNLGVDSADGFESFERLFEVLGSSTAEIGAGRRRWQQYKSRGYAIASHAVGA